MAISWLLVFSVILACKNCLSSISSTPYTGNHINIHIVAHTHDDTGWVYTTDEYYIQIVRWIFDTVIPSLTNNVHRKFSYVEMAFFNRWWNEQTEDTQNQVRKLLNNQQLQLNLAGWCMNDEANPTMSAEIRQMTDGAMFALYNFGAMVAPRVGWHIDPFGSSYVTAGLWSQIGFDTFGINRISYWDKNQRKQDKNLEFIWKGSSSLGQQSWIFTHILDSYYCSPAEIDFAGHDGPMFEDQPYIVTDNNLPSWPPNYIEIAESFIADSRQRVSWFKHNHILIPFGCDFAHYNAYMSYIQMDKLMNYINSNSTYNASVFYSTLWDYTKAINALNLTWELSDVDFFNYQPGPHDWRVGFFTSRADLKAYVRSRENIIRTAELLYTFGRTINSKIIKFNKTAAITNITKLRRAIDVTQHHDAITGTEEDHVYTEYMVQMQIGTEDVKYFLNDVTKQFLYKNTTISTNDRLLIDNTVASTQQLTQNNIVPLILFNSLGWNVTQMISIGVNRTDLVIYDINNQLILSQINEVAMGSKRHFEPCKYSLFFIANLDAISFTTYFIKVVSNTEIVHLGKKRKQILNGKNLNIGDNGFYSLSFDGNTGFLNGIRNNILNKQFNVTNKFIKYGSAGDPLDDRLPQDDPYRFRPSQDNRYQMINGNKISNTAIYFRQFSNFSSNEKIFPRFIVQAHISNFNKNHSSLPLEQYNVHICDINLKNNSFIFQYYSIQNKSWPDTNYYTDWIIFNNDHSIQSNYLNDKYYGSISISKPSNSLSLNITINFNSNENFKTIPMILTSLRKTTCNDISQYVSTIIDISQSSVTLEILRIDATNPWPNDIYLDWIAWESNIEKDKSSISTQGITEITLPTNNDNDYAFNISLIDNPKFIVNEPVILVQIEQKQNNSINKIYHFATTTINNNYQYFTLSIKLLNPSSSSNGLVTLRINYWCFERIVMKELISKTVYENIVITGPLLDEIHQIFRTNYSQTFRVFNNPSLQYQDLRYIENNIILGWIDNRSNFVSSFGINDIDHNGSLISLQNSLEWIQRNYNPYIDEREAGNFYPSTSQSYIKNKNDTLRFSTIIDRAHGIETIIEDHEYRIMLQRRCAGFFIDIWNGDLWPIGCLDPTNNTYPLIYLLYDESEIVSYLNRRLFLLQQYIPLQFSTIFDGDINEWKNKYNLKWNAMITKQGLPSNIHLLDLRYAYSDINIGENNGLILQIWNMFEINENKQYSINQTILLNQLFIKNILNIDHITEMTLNGNIPLQNLNRLKWNVENKNKNEGNEEIILLDKDNKNRKKQLKMEQDTLEIQMIPRNIRTFIVNQNIT